MRQSRLQSEAADYEGNVEEQIKRVMGDILNLDPASINGTTVMDNTASWTSMNHVNLVVALEQEFQLLFNVTEIESMQSFADVVEIVKKKLQQ